MTHKVVWVTGASGFSGVHLARLLQETSDLTVIGIARKHAKVPGIDHFASIDLAQSSAVQTLAISHPPDYVIHLAGAMPPASIETLWSSNSQATLGLLTGLHLAGVERLKFLNVGSAAEYVPHSPGVYDENFGIGGASDYGRAKSAQEMIVRECGRVMGFEVILTRVFNLIGPGLSEELLLGRVCAQIRSGSDELSLGRLDSIRDFLDIRDAVRAYWLLAQNGIDGDTYNICSGVGTQIASVVDLAIEASGRSISITQREGFAKQGDVDRAVGTNKKIKSSIDWQPEVDLRRSVTDMLEQHPEL